MKTNAHFAIRFVHFGLLTGLLSLVTHVQAGERWYSDAQVARGARLFAEHCASCHGSKAEGRTKDWRQPDADGNYPPPPLNGTAHAWHHRLSILQRTVRDGGARLGGGMPGFADKLSTAEVNAVIAWMQAQWPDSTYDAWQKRNASSSGRSLNPVRGKSKAAKAVPTVALLQRLLPGIQLGSPSPSPIPGMVEVKVRDTYFYLTEDGKYAVMGDLLQLDQGQNLTQRKRETQRLALLRDFPDAKRLVYPAKEKEGSRLVVFTDSSCPYCRKLHGELAQLTSAGISVHYIPFPRGGPTAPAMRICARCGVTRTRSGP